MSKYIKKKKIINDMSFKVSLKERGLATRVDNSGEYHHALEEIDRIVARSQKILTSWWKKETDKPFILVCSQGNKAKARDNYSIKVDLSQLNLDEETMKRFKEGAIFILNEAFNKKS